MFSELIIVKQPAVHAAARNPTWGPFAFLLYTLDQGFAESVAGLPSHFWQNIHQGTPEGTYPVVAGWDESGNFVYYEPESFAIPDAWKATWALRRPHFEGWIDEYCPVNLRGVYHDALAGWLAYIVAPR